jgi:4-carboxymuconolactone decarboxylase
MPGERYNKGLAARREVLGASYVDAALGRATPFEAEFQEMVTEYCWGGTWGRGVMDRQKRSILNLGMLAALGRMHEFELHFRAALVNNKVPPDELKEVLLQIAVYCGIPAGVEVFRVARKVLAEEGVTK